MPAMVVPVSVSPSTPIAVRVIAAESAGAIQLIVIAAAFGESLLPLLFRSLFLSFPLRIGRCLLVFSGVVLRIVHSCPFVSEPLIANLHILRRVLIQTPLGAQPGVNTPEFGPGGSALLTAEPGQACLQLRAS